MWLLIVLAIAAMTMGFRWSSDRFAVEPPACSLHEWELNDDGFVCRNCNQQLGCD